MKNLSELGSSAIELIGKVNARNEAITGIAMFKTTPQARAALSKIQEPCSDMETFGSFVDSLHLFFYTGSGEGTRLLTPLPEFAEDVKFLSEMRREMKQGAFKEAAKKGARANGIIEKYCGRKTAEECGPEDFLTIQSRVMELLAGFLKHLLR